MDAVQAASQAAQQAAQQASRQVASGSPQLATAVGTPPPVNLAASHSITAADEALLNGHQSVSYPPFHRGGTLAPCSPPGGVKQA